MSNLHPLFKQILAPIAPMDSEVHSGQTIQELFQSADRAIAISQQYRAVEILKGAQMYLGEGQTSSKYPLDDDDIMACWLLSEICYCVEHEQTEFCKNCGKMRGLHSKWGESCPHSPDYSNPQAFYRSQFEAK